MAIAGFCMVHSRIQLTYSPALWAYAQLVPGRRDTREMCDTKAHVMSGYVEGGPMVA
ncbi:MAG: hypothetical protein ABSA65_15820 [Acidimicrobiales bacterium]